jgi:hypothetical protein
VQNTYALPSVALANIAVAYIFNQNIWNILLLVIDLEQSRTKTQAIISVMDKSYLAQNCIFIVLPVLIAVAYGDDLDGPAGLAGSAHDDQIAALVFMLVFNLVNVPHRIVQVLTFIPWLRKVAIRFYSHSRQEIMDNLYSPPGFQL